MSCNEPNKTSYLAAPTFASAGYQTSRGGRLVSATRRVVFGLAELIPPGQISTSLLKRLNGTEPQHVAPIHRKTRSVAKRRTGIDTQAQLFKSYYNLRRKHGSLKGQTPAQAAGLTELIRHMCP